MLSTNDKTIKLWKVLKKGRSGGGLIEIRNSINDDDDDDDVLQLGWKYN